METWQKNSGNHVAWSNTSLLNIDNPKLYNSNRKGRSDGGMALAVNKAVEV